MFAEFGTAEISILVVIGLAIIGFMRDSIKTKLKFNKEYTELSTSVNMSIGEIQKEVARVTKNLEDHVKQDREDRKSIYEKIESLHERIASDNEDLNTTIHESEKNILAKIAKLETAQYKCKNYEVIK